MTKKCKSLKTSILSSFSHNPNTLSLNLPPFRPNFQTSCQHITFPFHVHAFPLTLHQLNSCCKFTSFFYIKFLHCQSTSCHHLKVSATKVSLYNCFGEAAIQPTLHSHCSLFNYGNRLNSAGNHYQNSQKPPKFVLKLIKFTASNEKSLTLMDMEYVHDNYG